MENITVFWEVNVSEGNESFSLEELGVSSIEEWNQLSEYDQKMSVQEALDNISEQPYAIVSSWQ